MQCQSIVNRGVDGVSIENRVSIEVSIDTRPWMRRYT